MLSLRVASAQRGSWFQPSGSFANSQIAKKGGVVLSEGKKLVLQALQGEQCDRPPWVPFVGVHGAWLIGATAESYLQSKDLLLEGLRKAKQLYHPDGLPICFDLQLEAEVLGCRLQWADDAPPAVASHPLVNGSLAQLPEFSVDAGRIPLMLDATRAFREDVGDTIALYGLITGPFTLYSHLRGSELFIDLLLEPEGVHEGLRFCAAVASKMAGAYVQAGADVIAVVDPMTSQISTEHFAEFIAQPLDDVFDSVHASGAFSSLFVCGDATRNLEAMCRTRCDNVSIDENISLGLARTLAHRHEKSFGGNMKLTTALLLGTEADAMLDAIRCMDEAGSKGFVLAPGCDLPFETPSENLVAVSSVVRDEYQRQVARTTLRATSLGDFEDLVLPDYEQPDAVHVDVITLDSSACAPCLYMVDAARRAADSCDTPTSVREHKIKTREGLGHMCRLDVKNIPAICIDGKPEFISVIPDTATLVKRIEERWKTKAKG